MTPWHHRGGWSHVLVQHQREQTLLANERATCGHDCPKAWATGLAGTRTALCDEAGRVAISSLARKASVSGHDAIRYAFGRHLAKHHKRAMHISRKSFMQ